MTTENGPSVYDKANMDNILAGYGTWFSAHLFRLIAKADHLNKERLRLAFPDHVATFEEWQKGDTDLSA